MIKLFKATDKLYSTNGDLVLNPTKASIHKEDNGAFYLDLETPLSEKEVNERQTEQGTSVEGTSFELTNVDVTKQYEIQTLKGQTSQNGTPTPSSPQPINTTTGRQEVLVCGKNLFSGTFRQGNRIDLTNASRVFADSNYYLEQGKTYTFSTDMDTNVYRFAIYISSTPFPSNTTTYDSGWKRQTSFTFTASVSGYLGIIVSRVNDAHFTPSEIEGIKWQLEKGNQTTYEAYNGTTKEINLGKNLAKSVRVDSATSIYTVTLFLEADLQPSTTYTFSFNGTNGNRIYANENLFTTAPYISITNDRVVITLTTKDTLSKSDYRQYNSSYQKWVIFKNGQNEASANVYDDLLIEKGSQATSYSAYFTPIELCKIGTYQDYIFKNTTENPLYDSTLEEGQWYIHKAIGKVVLKGENSEAWAYDTNNHFFVSSAFGDYSRINNIPYCNYYKGKSNVGGGSALSDNEIAFNNASSNRLYIKNSSITSANNFKTWLSTHNTSVYYVLNTPTTTLIEDEELINELESIRLLQGLNNIMITSPYLPFIMDLHYNFIDDESQMVKYIDYLVPNNIVVANTPQGDQAFRITNVEKTRRKIKIKANHVFYDSANYLIADSYVVDKNCNDALDHLNNATDNTSPFTTISNVTHIDSFRCVRKSLYEAVQVVIERWGGHLTRDNWTFGIYDSIGQDNGVTIRYAKNLKDITASYDWNDVVTKLLPVGKDGILLNEIDPTASIYVESAQQYDIPYTKTISFEQNDIVEDNYKDDDGVLDEDTYKQALVDDLYSQAMKYITNNYLPKVNYKLSANVEKVSDVGDSVEVIDEKLGINLMTNIISYDYDCILKRYTQIEFGNFIPTLADLMTQISVNTEEQINANNETLQITLNEELQTATDKIWNALGNSYVIYEGDKILVVDTLPKEAATNVIMINNGGIAFSNSGITGTFSSAWTIDNVLNMENINVINLTADLIKGGTLKLGNALNQNGQIEVYDETNALIAELNKNGLKMYGADGSYVLMNNQVGFAGYDANNNKIYWVDKDEFHMKKSVIEEEITLCNKMRFIPIQIYDNNTLVNDGIGLVSVIGGGE